MRVCNDRGSTARTVNGDEPAKLAKHFAIRRSISSQRPIKLKDFLRKKAEIEDDKTCPRSLCWLGTLVTPNHWTQGKEMKGVKITLS